MNTKPTEDMKSVNEALGKEATFPISGKNITLLSFELAYRIARDSVEIDPDHNDIDNVLGKVTSSMDKCFHNAMNENGDVELADVIRECTKEFESDIVPVLFGIKLLSDFIRYNITMLVEQNDSKPDIMIQHPDQN